MRKKIIIAISTLIVVLIFISGAYEFPKYAGRMPVLILIFGIELYSWWSFKSSTTQWGKFVRRFFWIPDILLLLFFLIARIIPFQLWYGPLQAYFMGLILIIYLPRLVPVPFLLIKDIFRLIGKSSGHNYPRIQKWMFGNGIKFSLFTFVILIYGMLIGVYQFKVYDAQVKISNLPPSFEGLRIVQISDMHLGSWIYKRPIHEAITEINNLYPDIILFTGDLVNFTSDEAFRFKEELKSLKAPLGVYAILGNHDYGDYLSWPDSIAKQHNLDTLCGFYKQIGWKLMRNESTFIHKGTDSLLLIGVENWSVKKRYGHKGDIKKAMGNHSNAAVNILLSHDPTHWEYEVSKDFPTIDLTLSGHTHGMQMGFETKWFRFSPAQWMYKYWGGLYKKQNSTGKAQYLYVNRGLGHIGYPGRIGMNPEITLITLTSKE